MKLGITGLPGAGKTTIFEALTRNISDMLNKSENRIGTVQVPDSRVDVLSKMYMPKKTIYAQVEYFLPAGRAKDDKADRNIWTQVRDCDALIHVIRNFGGFETPKPYKDFQELNQELVLADLVVAEKRLERIELDAKRGKALDPEEHGLLIECRKYLEDEKPLRKFPHIATSQRLKGYAFVSAKPMLILINNADEDENMPDMENLDEDIMVIRGRLERELAQMSEEEAKDFLSEFNITALATDRVVRRSYELLDLMSFFTVGDDEVRAWTIKKNTQAMDAAGAVHSDIKKGFIRAEIVSYEDLISAGAYHEARKKGTVRLEGKTYEVKDGDIIHFRFNV